MPPMQPGQESLSRGRTDLQPTDLVLQPPTMNKRMVKAVPSVIWSQRAAREASVMLSVQQGCAPLSAMSLHCQLKL